MSIYDKIVFARQRKHYVCGFISLDKDVKMGNVISKDLGKDVYFI